MVVKHEVNVNYVYKEHDGRRVKMTTALKVAVTLGLYEMVGALLSLNADPNIQDHKGCSVLHYAVQNADFRMAKMLVSRGAQVNLADNSKSSPLHMATKYGHFELVKLFVQYGGDLYKRGPNGALPIHIASKEGHTHLIEYFAHQDVNVNNKVPCYDGKEKAALHVAAEEGHTNAVIALIVHLGAQIDIRDAEGETPLHCTVIKEYDPYGMKSKDDYAETAKVLIKHGANVDLRNLRGETPLHLASRNEFQRVVELLVEAGANPAIQDNDGNRPLHLVSENDAVSKNLLKEAMDKLEENVSNALEVKARGFTTSNKASRYKTKSTGDILEEAEIDSLGRTPSVPGLFMSVGSDKRLNNIEGIYKDGYLQPLGSRNTLNEENGQRHSSSGMYEAIDENGTLDKAMKRKRIASEVRRSREQMIIDSSSDSYKSGEMRPKVPSLKGRRSLSAEIHSAEQQNSTYTESLPESPQSAPSKRKLIPNPNKSNKMPNEHENSSQESSGSAGFYSEPPKEVQALKGINQDKNNNLNSQQRVNHKQSVPPVSKHVPYNISVGQPRFAQPTQYQPRPVMLTPMVGRGQVSQGPRMQVRAPMMAPLRHPQVASLAKNNNLISDSDDTFFDDASFDTLSDDNGEMGQVINSMNIQHIPDAKEHVQSEMVSVRVNNQREPRGDPKLMQTWLEEQARIVHSDSSGPVAQSSPQLTRGPPPQREVDLESVTTTSHSDAGEYDRRFTITLTPDESGGQQVTINTTELSKQKPKPAIRPKPAVRPRKSKSQTPPPQLPPQIPSRDTKPFASFRGKPREIPVPEVGKIKNSTRDHIYNGIDDSQDSSLQTSGDHSSDRLQWEKIELNGENSMHWDRYTGTEQIYEAIKDDSKDEIQQEDAYIDMISPGASPEESPSHAPVQMRHPPPSTGSPQRRNSKSKPVAIPEVPSSPNRRNLDSQISMVSTDSMRSSRTSVSSVNTVIYVPEKEKEIQESTSSLDDTETESLKKTKVGQQKGQTQKLFVTQDAQKATVKQVEQIPNDSQGDLYEEIPHETKKKVTVGGEDVYQETESLPADVREITYKSGNKLPVTIVGGNAEGIYVHRIDPGCDAEQKGIMEGDKILRVNDEYLQGKTREQAQLLLMETKGDVKLYVTQKKEDYERVVRGGGSGDSFFIRTAFDYEGKTGEISFRKGEIVSVKDTLPSTTMMGSWLASRLYASPTEEKSGLMPNEQRAEQIVLSQSQVKTIDKEQKGGFLRRSMRKSKSQDKISKEKERTASVSSTQLDGPVYERVDQRYPGFIRPVVLLGLFCDAVRDKLCQDCPEKFEVPPPEAELPIHDNMAEVEKQRLLSGQQAAIKRVIGRRRHCVLVSSPKCVQRFVSWNLHPIIIFMNVENKHMVKTLKAKYAPKDDRKPNSMFEDSVAFERDFSHIFTATVPFTSDDSWFTLLKDSIGRIQNLPVWQKIDESEEQEQSKTHMVETERVTSTTSAGQQRVVHYVQQRQSGDMTPSSPTRNNASQQPFNPAEPDRPDLGVVRPGVMSSPPHGPPRMQHPPPQQAPPRPPYQQPPYHYQHYQQQQQYYYQQQAYMQQQYYQQQQYHQQQMWLQQQQAQARPRASNQTGVPRPQHQVNILSYMGSEPAHPRASSNHDASVASTESSVSSGQAQQQQVTQQTQPSQPVQYASIRRGTKLQAKETNL